MDKQDEKISLSGCYNENNLLISPFVSVRLNGFSTNSSQFDKTTSSSFADAVVGWIMAMAIA